MDEAALQKSFFLGFRRRVYKTKNSVIESKVPRYKLQKSSSGPNESYESKQVKKNNSLPCGLKQPVSMGT